MRFKRYTLLSVIFIVLVVAYTHLNIDTIYTVDFFGYRETFPVAIWVVIPAVLLLIASLGHFGFYSLLGSIKRSRLEKDLNKSKSMVKNALLKHSRLEPVKDERLALLAELLANAKVRLDENFFFKDEELNEIISMLNRIDAGEYVDLGRFKLPFENEINMKNMANRLDFDPGYAEKILNNCTEPEALCLKAFEAYAKTADKKKIERIALKKTKAIVFAMLSRLHAEKNALDFSKDEIVALCKEVELGSDDYVKLAKVLQTTLAPDELLETCYHLQLEIEEAASAYLYVNLELEKNNVAKEYLEQFDQDELSRFRHYMILKENGAKVTLSEFI